MITVLKRGVLFMILVVTAGFSEPGAILELGDPSSSKTWVYLCGLTETINSEQEIENRQGLDQLGKKLNIRFLALHPFERCERAGNKLCWIHYTDEQTLETYDKILSAVSHEDICGFIGFSNGGFFLNSLAQMRELYHPIISIGAAGSFNSTSTPNTITLIVGKLEVIYESAHTFFNKAKGSSLSVSLIEHEGDHIVPFNSLEKLMKEK
ncbi:MAG: hypothetical protein HYX35_02725 [Proteobacteria bacterium]|nr:hypothetical protein [Pseudomonadota bacterium]